jgi:hypothetical protein
MVQPSFVPGETFMDSLNKNFIWLSGVPAFAKELSGRFVT